MSRWTLSRELKHEEKPAVNTLGGGRQEVFRAEGIACEVALRQGMTLSVSRTELDPWLRPGEQRGDP